MTNDERMERLVKDLGIRSRIGLVALAALLALPAALLALPASAKQGPRTVTRTVTQTFSNSAPVIVQTYETDDPVKAEPYPSQIVVGGLKQGRIRDVNVRLNTFTHLYPDDVQVLLVGPEGQTAILMASAGGSTDALAVTLRLDDEATASLPDQDSLESGAFKPTNVTSGLIDFIDLDPDPGPGDDLSVFDGTDPNGTWRLYIQDEYGKTDPGVLTTGWSLDIQAQVKEQKKKRSRG